MDKKENTSKPEPTQIERRSIPEALNNIATGAELTTGGLIAAGLWQQGKELLGSLTNNEPKQEQAPKDK